MIPATKTQIKAENDLNKYHSYLTQGVKAFVSPNAEVSMDEVKDVKALAAFIDETTGEYNYFTARNDCFVTLKEAVDKKYLYMRQGRPRQMEATAVLEWVYFHHPELEDGLDLEEVERLKQEYLASDDLYPFFKVDVIDVNVYRRMTRKNNTPEKFIMRNLKGLSKKNNGHLQGEEEITRRCLYNTYFGLLKLWELGYTPTVIIPKQESDTEESHLMTI